MNILWLLIVVTAQSDENEPVDNDKPAEVDQVGNDEIVDEKDIVPPQIEIVTFNEHPKDESKHHHHDDLTTPPTQQVILQKGKAPKNYAAASCGAKIDKHAPDLLNAKYVLSPSKDHYARADCAKKFFFTIELCEIIRLDRIEIASYELFSSRAKDFKISAADAEKLRWMDLGNFLAAKFTQKNNLQTFPIGDEYSEIYVKYIKFEMVSYQGEEPLCTLTWFGVFGWGEFNPLPDDPDDDPSTAPGIENDKTPQEDPDPIKKGVEFVGGIISKAIWGEKTNKTLEEPQQTMIDDSFHDCWFQSAVLCYCDEDCVDFIGAPYLDVYTGPYVNPEPPTKEAPIELDSTDNYTAPINETKQESSQPKKQPEQQVVLKSQIKEFEANLTRVGEYLETLSKSYKQQMTDMRTSFNRTASRLTKVENSSRDINESIMEILDMIKFLYREVNRLDTSFEKVILASSIMIGFQFIILLLWCRPRRDSVLTQQLAKMEIQLDLLKDEISQLNESKSAHLSEHSPVKRRYTMDDTRMKKHRHNSKSDTVFVEEAESN